MGKKVKNKDIADKLGVSSTLVSLVLNNKADQHGIRKDTQERVLALARQMGYFDLQKSENEISPVEEKPGLIGMIIPAQCDPFIYKIAPYLEKAFMSIGVGFSLIARDIDDRRYNRLMHSLKKFYTGLILVGDTADEQTVRYLRSSSYPFVLLEKSMKTLPLNSVCTDNSEGARRVTNHINKLGYRNIIIIKRSVEFPAKEHPMFEILKESLTNLPDIKTPAVVEVENLSSGMELDFGQLEKYLRPPFSAELMIVLQSDLVYPVMAAFRKRNLRIPQDIALISMEEGIGFDLLFSPVTCLRKPLPAMSLKLANMIWSEVKNSGKGKYKRQVNLSPDLVVRNSCGAL